MSLPTTLAAHATLTSTLLVGLAGCGEPAKVHVSWPSELPSVSFFLHSDGELVRELRGPFVSVGESPPSFEFTEIEGLEGYLVGFELEILRERFPRLPVGLDGSELQLEAEPERCEDGRFEATEAGHRRSLSAKGLAPSVWSLGPEDSAWTMTTAEALIEKLRLWAPEDTAACVSNSLYDSYRAFGAKEALLESFQSLGGVPIPTRAPIFGRADDVFFIDVAWLDDDNVIAMSRGGVFWVERGGEIDDLGTRYRAVSATLDALIPGDYFFLNFVVLDPRPRADGLQNLIFVSTNADLPGRPRIALLGQLGVGASGFSEPEILWQGDRGVRALQFEASGRGIAVGNSGLVLILDPDPSMPIVEQSFQDGVPWLSNLELTGDPSRPHIVMTDQNSYLLGDIVSGEVEFIPPFENRAGTPSATAHYSVPEGVAVLSSLYLGGLLLYESGRGWSPIRFALPHRAGECAALVDECGFSQPGGGAVRFRGDAAGWFLGLMGECEAVFMLDVKNRCARVLLGEGQTTARTNERGFLRGLEIRGRRALASGTEGRLVEFDLP